jgi:hypothetical protein
MTTIVGIGGAVLILVLLVTMAGGGGGGDDSGQTAGDAGAAARTEQSSRPARSTAPMGTEQPGKTPTRPAPTIDPERLARADEHYGRGKDLWNEAQKARRAGDQRLYGDKLKEAFAAMDAWRDEVRIYREWYAEASMEEWRIPAEYDGLIRGQQKAHKLYTNVRKLQQQEER